MNATIPGADHSHPFPIMIHCHKCRGQNVTRDAVARWDAESQRWIMGTVFDNGDCLDCGSASLVERKLDGSPVSALHLFKGETWQS